MTAPAAAACRPARRPEKTQSASESPLTYEREHRPTAVRPGCVQARHTAARRPAAPGPVSSATTSPPRVSMGAGLATRGRTEQSMSEYGGLSWART